jgi:hypothetical protein
MSSMDVEFLRARLSAGDMTWRENDVTTRTGAMWLAPECDDQEDDGHDREGGGEDAVHAGNHDGSHKPEKGGV